MHGAEQRERGVTQPAEAIIPVALAAELFRQRRRRRRDDAAGRAVGESLERDHRAPHRIRPAAGGPAFRRPLAPKRFGVGERAGGVDRPWRRLMRRRIAHHERDRLAAADGEFTDRGHVAAAQMHRRVQHHHVGPRNGAERAALHAAHPGHDGAIAEAQNQFGVHRQLAACANYEAHDGRMRRALRHEIDQCGGAVRRFEMGLQHQGIGAVVARDASVQLRRDQPAAVLARAEQCSEAGFGIKTWPAQPIN